MTHDDLGFHDAAERSFGFLLERGFTCSWSAPTRLVFESADVRVTLSFDRERSYEIDVAVGLREAWERTRIGLADAARALAGIEQVPFQASAPKRVESTLRELGRITREHLGDLVDGAVPAFERVLAERERHTAAAHAERVDGELRQDLDAAWRARDYPRVVALLEALQGPLSASEREKLAYARRRAGD